MKTNVLVLACLIIIASGSGALAKGKGRSTCSVSELVKKEIPYPDFAFESRMSGSVNIFLGETENGPTLVAVSTNPMLSSYVQKRLEGMKVELIAAFEQENSRYTRVTFLYKER